MKQILSLILFTTFLNAQENISIGIYQDARLLVLGDDKGNKPGTLDIKVDMSLQGKQFQHYYFEVRPQFEYANLSGGKYVSWLINGGWVFNQLLIKNLEAGAYLTIGTIHRWQSSWITYGLTGDLSYKIGRFKISLLAQAIKANDLKQKWNDDKYRISVYGGFKYDLFQ